MARVIVTSALPYAYFIPHLGNFVGSVLPADVYYRYLRMKGEDAIFICGSDQHGTPIELEAVKKNVEPEQLANEMHETLKTLFGKYSCAFTHYGKTHTQENKEVTYNVFNELYSNGYILEREDMQAYCNIDKRFLTDRFIQGTCPYCHTKNARGDQCNNCDRLLEPTQIIEPFCAVCGKSDITFVKTKNLALDLVKLQNDVKTFIKKNAKYGWSRDAINKSLSMIEEGLKPRDMTRNMRWGFPVPLAGYDNSVIYVWFDAVLGYIGITKEWDARRWRDYWQNSSTQLVQFLGKDNVLFHTIIWPAMLIGSNLGFVLPHSIKSSQFLVSKTVKFSKSKGVGLNMKNALEILPADYWRFALMYMYPESSDSEFSVASFQEVVNTIMNDKIGNFVQRVLKMARSNSGLIEKEITAKKEQDVERMLKRYSAYFDKLRLREALKEVIKLAGRGNEIMSGKEPWAMAKKAGVGSSGAREFTQIASNLISMVYCIAITLFPFTPTASSKLLSYFGVKGDPSLELLDKPAKIDLGSEPQPMFHKMSKTEIEKLRGFS